MRLREREGGGEGGREREREAGVKARREGRGWGVCSKGKYPIIAGKGVCKRKCSTCVVCTADLEGWACQAQLQKRIEGNKERERARERETERARDFSRCECSG